MSAETGNREAAQLQALPFITPDLPGCGGRLKAEPSHFVVEELPLYPAQGEGAHLYVCLTREGWNTRQVTEELARLYRLPSRDVGYAGLKDRHARATQVFSLPGLQAEDAEAISRALPFQVEWARQHGNKLKIGHLLGNRFRITVTDLEVPPSEALQRARAVAQAIARRGVPNFYGTQRFGIEARNISRGRDALLGQGPWLQKWLRKLMISAYQSHLFNLYLTLRIEQSLFQQLLPGDIAKKADTGGMFEVTDLEVEQPRYERGEIHFTGPIYGKKMWAAGGAAGALEREILDQEDLAADVFQRARVQGSRRPARLWLPDIAVTIDASQLHLAFCLPKGAYATVVAREFTKNDAGELFPVEENEEEEL